MTIAPPFEHLVLICWGVIVGAVAGYWIGKFTVVTKPRGDEK